MVYKMENICMKSCFYRKLIKNSKHKNERRVKLLNQILNGMVEKGES